MSSTHLNNNNNNVSLFKMHKGFFGNFYHHFNTSNNNLQCICLTPTYELALQIGEVTEKMGKYMSGLDIGYAIRGVMVKRYTAVNHHIIIGTPGTMINWCFNQRIIDMKKVNVFVLDEADVMIDKEGYLDQSVRLKKLVLWWQML